VTVLIVDDSSVMRKVIGRTLLQAGLEMTEVLEAENGLDALALVRARATESRTLRLILIDINMPVMSGFEFVERMREEGLMPEVPVVMITTEASEPQVRRAVTSGAAGYIRKPFTAAQLKSCVARLVTTL
jgi:two-component system chemotaxis response regulator CheY